MEIPISPPGITDVDIFQCIESRIGQYRVQLDPRVRRKAEGKIDVENDGFELYGCYLGYRLRRKLNRDGYIVRVDADIKVYAAEAGVISEVD